MISSIALRISSIFIQLSFVAAAIFSFEDQDSGLHSHQEMSNLQGDKYTSRKVKRKAIISDVKWYCSLNHVSRILMMSCPFLSRIKSKLLIEL